MKYLDCVEVIVEKEKYAKDGVHKGMQGVIWNENKKRWMLACLFYTMR